MEIKRNPENLKKLTASYIRSSKERLNAANLLLKERLFRDSISRSYYAFLDAADALLLTKDLRPKSHAGTIRLCNIHFVHTGILDKKYGAWFKKIEKARLEAEYERWKEFTKDDAEEVLKEAEEFVKTVEKLLSFDSLQGFKD